MSRYVVDTWAWVEYLRGTQRSARIKEKVEKSNAVTSVATVAEVISKFHREGLDVNEAFESMTSLSKIANIDAGLARFAGLLHATIRKSSPNFSLADAFVLQTAKSLNAKVLTGDPDFEGIKEAEILH